MRKFIIAIGILTILATLNVPSWGKDKLIHVCYLEKKQQARVVKKTNDCNGSEMAIALNKKEPKGSDQEISKRAQEVARRFPPSLHFIFESDASGARYGDTGR